MTLTPSGFGVEWLGADSLQGVRMPGFWVAVTVVVVIAARAMWLRRYIVDVPCPVRLLIAQRYDINGLQLFAVYRTMHPGYGGMKSLFSLTMPVPCTRHGLENMDPLSGSKEHSWLVPDQMSMHLSKALQTGVYAEVGNRMFDA
jgi:hypothetical protein